MNGLSWVIYLAGIANGLSTVLGMLAFLSIVSMLIATIWFFVISFNPNVKDVLDSTPYFKSFRAWAVTCGILFNLLFYFIPDRQTIILIAGSEIGQKVAQSDQVKGIVDPGMDLLKSWIANETAKLQPPLPKVAK